MKINIGMAGEVVRMRGLCILRMKDSVERVVYDEQTPGKRFVVLKVRIVSDALQPTCACFMILSGPARLCPDSHMP